MTTLQYPLVKCETCEAGNTVSGYDYSNCQDCNGFGRLIKKECKTCKGDGHTDNEFDSFCYDCWSKGFTTEKLLRVGERIFRDGIGVDIEPYLVARFWKVKSVEIKDQERKVYQGRIGFEIVTEKIAVVVLE